MNASKESLRVLLTPNALILLDHSNVSVNRDTAETANFAMVCICLSNFLFYSNKNKHPNHKARIPATERHCKSNQKNKLNSKCFVYYFKQ